MKGDKKEFGCRFCLMTKPIEQRARVYKGKEQCYSCKDKAEANVRNHAVAEVRRCLSSIKPK